MSTRNRLKKRNRNESIPKVDSLVDFIIEDEEDEKEEYNPYFPSRQEYENESNPLQEELIVALASSLNVPEGRISQIVSSIFEINQYDLQPSNRSWKQGVDKTTIKKLEPQLSQLRSEMEKNIPTIPRILSANITREDKKRCLRFFDEMKNVEQYSSDYFRLQDSINEILGKSMFHSKEEIRFLEREEQKLKKLTTNLDNLKTKILKLDASDEIKGKLLGQYEEMISYPSDSHYYLSLKEEVEWAVKLPYQMRETDSYVNMNNVQLNKFYCNVRKLLDQELFGMEYVKNRIIQVLNDRRSSGDECGRNIALVGPPGTGKTAIGKVLAKVLNKKFAKISAGALDSAAIKGSNKVWSGSEPSIVLQTLATLKTNNPLIMFDEIDKLGETPQGKLAQHALLHISDPTDNKEFQDNYLKHSSHDLSKILFIYTMNSTECLDSALEDRLDIIELSEYTNDEKFQIFKNYMFPRALMNVKMDPKDVIVSDGAINRLLKIDNFGLRTLEKIIKNIIGKINMYKNTLLPNGTLGKLHVNYKIKDFKIPLKIDYELLLNLMK